MNGYTITLGNPDTLPDDPAVVVIPAPYDRTACYQPGSRRGPDAILTASANMEFYDEVLGFDPSRVGIATLAPLEVSADGPRLMCDRVRDVVAAVLAEKRLPLVLGGEHSVTIGAIEAVAAVHPSVSILHLDAHADLRDEYEGSRYSHACVMRRARERCKAVSLGIRSVSEAEASWARETGTALTSVRECRERGWDLDALCGDLGDEVYVTLDVDALDPSIMPATGTPEPGGFVWDEIDALLAWVAERRRVVGFDIVELMPIPGFVAPDYLVARLAYRMIGRVLGSRRQRDGGDV